MIHYSCYWQGLDQKENLFHLVKSKGIVWITITLNIPQKLGTWFCYESIFFYKNAALDNEFNYGKKTEAKTMITGRWLKRPV